MIRSSALLLLIIAASCNSSEAKRTVKPRFSVAEVPAAIAASEVDLDDGRYEVALERLRSAKNTPGLPARERQAVQISLERAAQAVIANSTNDADLQELTDVDIPRPMAVEAGIRAAQLQFADGERMKAFRLLRKLDAKFPRHPRRMQAASLLFKIGKNLAQDEGRYMLIFRYKANAPQVLEYLVMNHPSATDGAESLWLLGELYEDSKELGLAIEKHQDLMLWYPESEYVIRSQAAIPRLRLAMLGSPEYDRSELLVARAELEALLAEHGDPGLGKLSGEVRRLLTDTIRRLADNDLGVARFYDRVDSSEGAAQHARRAFDLAREGGDEEQVEEARRLLESLQLEGSAP